MADALTAVIVMGPHTGLHLAAGGAAASAGVNIIMMISFSFLTWFTLGSEEILDAPEHAPDSTADFPLPSFLENAGYQRTINIGVFGVTGSGKSSLVNTLRGKKPGDADAAPVGVLETTTEPVPYNLIASDQKQEYSSTSGTRKDHSRVVRIWDLPGVGTEAFPSEHCVREMGLRYFDIVILVMSGSASELELNVAAELNSFKVPHFIVRSQVDSDIENEMADYCVTSDEAEHLLRKELSTQGHSSVFLVSSRQPDRYDFQQLSSNIVASVQARRRTHTDDACPICFENFDEELKACRCQWCRNCVCNNCTVLLQGKLDETPCPFCRRWTTLEPDASV